MDRSLFAAGDAVVVEAAREHAATGAVESCDIHHRFKHSRLEAEDVAANRRIEEDRAERIMANTTREGAGKTCLNTALVVVGLL